MSPGFFKAGGGVNSHNSTKILTLSPFWLSKGQGRFHTPPPQLPLLKHPYDKKKLERGAVGYLLPQIQ
jgi:hypothetical protein